MPTLKQITKSPHWWGKLKPGAQIRAGRRGETVDIVVEHGDTVRRMFNTYTSWDNNAVGEYRNGSYIGPKLNENLTLMTFRWPVNGELEHATCKPDQVDFIVLPAVPKSFRSSATKGSRWRFHTDWTFSGYDGRFDEYTIPAGTEFVIASNKTSMTRWGRGLSWKDQVPGMSFEEKGIAVEPFTEMQAAFPASWRNEHVLPMKEVAGYVELVEAGDTKTYWLIQDNDGNRIVDKRFKGLSNLKASLRVRGGLVKYQSGEDGDYVPEWLEGDNEWTQDRFNKGVWAVQYDHTTDQELKREDMLEYMFMAKLKG